jgi:hypothetical protein
LTLVSTQLKNKLAQLESQWPGYVNMLKILESSFLSPKHWVLEFLQNAEDVTADGVGRLSIRLKDDFLWILNNGREFDQSDLRAICDVASQKRPSLGLHGYLGIGFKSVFRITNRVDIHSGQLHFSFHREHWHETLEEKGKSIWDWPWEILPIEIDPTTLDDEYTTGFRADLSSRKSQEVLHEISDFLNKGFPKEAILLLKNIHQIEVQTPQKSFIITKKTAEPDIFGTPDGMTCKKERVTVHTQSTVPGENSDEHFLTFLRPVRIEPEIREDEETERVRRSDVEEREIGLVIGMDDDGGLRALSGKVAGVYSFLPVEEEQTGLPFGIFGDFVPQPGRDLINYEAKWNKWMCDRIVEFFKYVVREIIVRDHAWMSYPAELAQKMNRSALAGTGDRFWAETLRKPIEKFLEDEALYTDDQDNLRKRDELLDVAPDVLKITGKEMLTTVTGKHMISDRIRGKVTVEPVTIYELSHMPKVLEGIKDKPQNLAELYEKIGGLDSYQIQGRPDSKKRGRPRDMPLPAVDIALGEDNQLHPPQESFVFDIDIRSIPPNFMSAVFPTLGEKHRLHPKIAKRPKAVEGLKKCGLTVVDKQEFISRLRQLLGRITKADDRPKTWVYPDDLIRAALFLLESGDSLPDCLVSEDENLTTCKYSFVPGAPLDWAPLYRAYLLPMYKPIHNAYFKQQWLTEFGINRDAYYSQLESAGVHGFHADKDGALTENAAYAIALSKLNAYHDNKVTKVTHGKELGYDLECKGHCSEVFEVKGMSDPSELPLQPSEFREIKAREDQYHLICVYNLPAPPDKVGYKDIPNPASICRPVERAVIPKDAWLRA